MAIEDTQNWETFKKFSPVKNKRDVLLIGSVGGGASGARRNLSMFVGWRNGD